MILVFDCFSGDHASESFNTILSKKYFDVNVDVAENPVFGLSDEVLEERVLNDEKLVAGLLSLITGALSSFRF
jgi:hypothetical protein